MFATLMILALTVNVTMPTEMLDRQINQAFVMGCVVGAVVALIFKREK